VVVDEVKVVKERTYEDIMEELNLNPETRTLLKEKITELHKDVDNKVRDRQLYLENKLKEVEDSLKPGKKK